MEICSFLPCYLGPIPHNTAASVNGGSQHPVEGVFISGAPRGQTRLIRIYIHAAARLQRVGVNGSFGIDVID